MFEDAKSSLGKGSLEDAEQYYNQLWQIFIEQKLKWNKEIYGQLSVLSRQFSTELSNAYTDVKKKADRIYELIGRAKTALREGKKDVPFKLYSEIKKINNSIPHIFFEENNIIHEQVMDFYKELRNTTDNELIKRVYELIRQINQAIDNINVLMMANNIAAATDNYHKCVELYKQVPEGFIRHKNDAGIRLLEIYKGLSIYNEIQNLQKQLGQPSLRQQQKVTEPEPAPKFQPAEMKPAHIAPKKIIKEKKERAKKNIENGLYNEASKDIEEVLRFEPNDAEAKALHAKIKTLQ